MRGKLLFITGGLVGYVLGARAGRKRYDQIAAAANDLWNAKPVQRRVTDVRDAALELVGDVPSVLLGAGKKAFAAVADKKQQGKQSAASGAAAAKAKRASAASGGATTSKTTTAGETPAN